MFYELLKMVFSHPEEWESLGYYKYHTSAVREAQRRGLDVNNPYEAEIKTHYFKD